MGKNASNKVYRFDDFDKDIALKFINLSEYKEKNLAILKNVFFHMYNLRKYKFRSNSPEEFVIKTSYKVKLSGSFQKFHFNKSYLFNFHRKDLAERFLHKNYDPNKMFLSHYSARRLARQFIKWMSGGKPPEIHKLNAFIGKKKKTGNLFNRLDHTETIRTKMSEGVDVRECFVGIELEEHDKEYIVHFCDCFGLDYPHCLDSQYTYEKYDEESRDKISNKLAKKLVQRYSNFIIGQKYFKNKEVVKWKPYGLVPVQTELLRERIEKLKEIGVDFTSIPLNMTAAKQWLNLGKIKPGYKITRDRKISFDKNYFKKFVEYQDLHISNPEQNPSPNITTNPNQKRWSEIIFENAKVASKVALRSFISSKQSSEFLKGDIELLVQDIYVYLSCDEVVSPDPLNYTDYNREEWRISQAIAEGRRILEKQYKIAKKTVCEFEGMHNTQQKKEKPSKIGKNNPVPTQEEAEKLIPKVNLNQLAAFKDYLKSVGIESNKVYNDHLVSEKECSIIAKELVRRIEAYTKLYSTPQNVREISELVIGEFLLKFKTNPLMDV